MAHGRGIVCRLASLFGVCYASKSVYKALALLFWEEIDCDVSQQCIRALLSHYPSVMKYGSRISEWLVSRCVMHHLTYPFVTKYTSSYRTFTKRTHAHKAALPRDQRQWRP